MAFILKPLSTLCDTLTVKCHRAFELDGSADEWWKGPEIDLEDVVECGGTDGWGAVDELFNCDSNTSHWHHSESGLARILLRLPRCYGT